MIGMLGISSAAPGFVLSETHTMFRSRKQRHAFEKEALPHLDALYAMALRLTRNSDDAEDLVQDAMVKAYRFFHRYEAGSNIRAWLFKLLVNLFYNTQRKVQKDQRLQLETRRQQVSEADLTNQRFESLLGDRLVQDRLRAALEELPEEFRLGVVLCDLYDFSYREIAEILDCPVGTVMSRLYRGRRMLQEELFEYAREQGYLSPPRGAQAPTDLEAYRQMKKAH